MEGPWQQPHVDSGAEQLVPVPSPLGGVLVVGENAVSYLGGGPGGAAPPVSAPIKQTIVKVGRRRGGQRWGTQAQYLIHRWYGMGGSFVALKPEGSRAPRLRRHVCMNWSQRTVGCCSASERRTQPDDRHCGA